MNPNVIRIAVAALSLSAAAFVGLAIDEGYTDEAIIPTKGDRPTYGYGSTFKEDGAPVRMGDRTTPVRALVTAQTHLAKEEAAFRKSLFGAYLSQAEYDAFVDFSYQYGTAAWNKSSMRRHVLAGEYRQACNALLKYKFSAGYDCSSPGNRICSGVWKRQLERHKKCMEAQ